MQPFAFEFSPLAQDGEAASSDGLYRWAMWRFWDVTRPYIVFVGLWPRGLKEPALERRVSDWLERWERGDDRTKWRAGGYVVVNLLARVAGSVAELRRLHAAGVDVAGQRAADACLVFARNPACIMIVMMPGIDEAPDLRDGHQALVLSALTGLGKHVAVVDDVTQMPREWKA